MLEICTTVSSKAEAQRTANALVKQKLGACVSFWPVFSVYRWKGKVHKAGEWVLCAKTSEKLGKKCEKKLRELHPYEMPVISVQRVKVDQNVEKWVT